MASSDLTLPVHVRVSGADIDPAALERRVRVPAAGAVVVFLGTVRDHSPGKPDVSHLEYEAYAEHVEARIREITGEAVERWPLLAVAVEHRTGRLEVGDVAVVVAVSSVHRGDAFAAAGHLIDELKERAPIWKKEHWSGGAEWVEGA